MKIEHGGSCEQLRCQTAEKPWWCWACDDYYFHLIGMLVKMVSYGIPSTFNKIRFSFFFFFKFTKVVLLIAIIVKRQMLRMLLLSKRGPHSPVGSDAPRVSYSTVIFGDVGQ